MKNPISFLRLFFFFLIVVSIGNTAFSQVSCSNPAGIPPYTENSKCLDAPATSATINYANSNFPDDWGDRIADYANQPMVGAKQKFRSVFVNESINGRGGFANPKDAATQNNIHFDPNAVGSTFAIDVDGDAIYEREDALLQKLVDLDFMK